ncbi:hypothetical protein ACIBCU_38035 [Streptomyces sp. NPDC051064]
MNQRLAWRDDGVPVHTPASSGAVAAEANACGCKSGRTCCS